MPAYLVVHPIESLLNGIAVNPERVLPVYTSYTETQKR